MAPDDGRTLDWQDGDGRDAQSLTAADVLLNQLRENDHEAAEQLRRYEAIRRSDPNASIGFLLEVVLDDEVRHRQWLRTVADGVRASLKQTRNPLPAMSTENGDQPVLAAEIDEFLLRENGSLERLRELKETAHWLEADARTLYWENYGAREVDKPERTARWMRSSPLALLVDRMIEDTKRDIRLLKSIKRRLRHAPAHGLAGQLTALLP